MQSTFLSTATIMTCLWSVYAHLYWLHEDEIGCQYDVLLVERPIWSKLHGWNRGFHSWWTPLAQMFALWAEFCSSALVTDTGNAPFPCTVMCRVLRCSVVTEHKGEFFDSWRPIINKITIERNRLSFTELVESIVHLMLHISWCSYVFCRQQMQGVGSDTYYCVEPFSFLTKHLPIIYQQASSVTWHSNVFS